MTRQQFFGACLTTWIFIYCATHLAISNDIIHKTDINVYLPGGGFSGFFYTRGVLDADDVKRDDDKSYFCFSGTVC